jgi:hypothetical protein
LGGQSIILQDLNVSDGIELCLLVGPYLPGIFAALQELSTSTLPETKTQILRALVQSAQNFPGDLMKMIGLFARRRPKWIAENAKVIIEQAEFGEVLKMGSRLGLIKPVEKVQGEDGDGRN